MVLYQGARAWNFPRAFEALIGPPPAGDAGAGEGREHEGPAQHTLVHIPRFEPLFVNLQSLSDDEFHGGVRTVVALLFLKYLARRIDREAALVLLDAMRHADGIMIARRAASKAASPTNRTYSSGSCRVSSA